MTLPADPLAPTDPPAPPTPPGPPWSVRRNRGTAAHLHALTLPEPPRRTVWIQEVVGTALVLGSTQSEDGIDPRACAAAGVEVTRRRSGGGAVLVEPGGLVWIDLVLPPGDPLAHDDVGRAAHWVGGLWAEALAAFGIAGVSDHRGAMVDTRWSRLVCFAGLGPGEVSVEGAKVVGVSQRRTRQGTRFSTAALLRWEPARLAPLLRLNPLRREQLVADLAERARPAGVGADALIGTLLAGLPGGVAGA